MKKRNIVFMLIMICALLCCACAAEEQKAEDYHIDLSDPSQGIYTAADLIAFFENGEGDTAVLGGSVDLDGAMLKLSEKRGKITIIGGGNSITSSADCVIRMENGAELSLNDLTLIAGAEGVGCLGDAKLAGTGLDIQALTNAIYCAGDLSILQESKMKLLGNKGSGIVAQSVSIGKNSDISAYGEQSAVHTLKNDLSLAENAKLYAQTSSYYCALKCSGILHMENGSVLRVKNEGEYHGAELEGVDISGAVTIEADGGSCGAGLFIFNLKDSYTVAGHCEPPLRSESGKGELRFVQSVEQIRAEETASPEAEEVSNEDADTREQ